MWKPVLEVPSPWESSIRICVGTRIGWRRHVIKRCWRTSPVFFRYCSVWCLYAEISLNTCVNITGNKPDMLKLKLNFYNKRSVAPSGDGGGDGDAAAPPAKRQKSDAAAAGGGGGAAGAKEAGETLTSIVLQLEAASFSFPISMLTCTLRCDDVISTATLFNGSWHVRGMHRLKTLPSPCYHSLSVSVPLVVVSSSACLLKLTCTQYQ